MIKTGIDARVKVQQIIDNQLPEFVLSEAPKAAEFLKQYYISQEYQGRPIDIAENLDQYINFNNMTQDVVAGITSLTSAISSSDTTIAVDNTNGYWFTTAMSGGYVNMYSAETNELLSLINDSIAS